MGVEQLVDGEVPNIMKNRERKKENVKIRGSGKGEGIHPTLLLFFQFLCFIIRPWDICLL